MSYSEGPGAEHDGNPTACPPQPIGGLTLDGVDHNSSTLLHMLGHLASPEQRCLSPLRENEGVHKKQRSRQRGRPVKYQGDPNAPGLDPAQRRQLQRRISNRESARRTRKRHEYQLTGMHAKVQDLHENCRAVEAQVDALKLQLSQSDALEKRLTEVLHVKDEQLEASKRKNASLESAISGLTLRLKEQDMLRLELQLELQSCRSAMSTFSAELSHTEALVRPGSGSLSQNWDPFAPSESAPTHTCDGGHPSNLDHATGRTPHPARQLLGVGMAAREAAPSSAMPVYTPCECDYSAPRVSRQNAWSGTDMESPDISASSEDADCTQAGLMYMMREVGLLPSLEATCRRSTLF